MKQGNIRDRDAFIANIAKRLGRDTTLQTLPPLYNKGIPEQVKELKRTTAENRTLFMQNWTALTGRVWLVPEKEAQQYIAAIIHELIEELTIDQISIWEHERLAELGLAEKLDGKVRMIPWRRGYEDEGTQLNISQSESHPVQKQVKEQVKEQVKDQVKDQVQDQLGLSGSVSEEGSNWSQRSALLQATERSDLGIVWPDFAVANTGSIILEGGIGRGRSVSLLPGSLLGILHEEQLVTRLGEAFPKQDQASVSASGHLTLPSSYTIITGPSRSADIENDLTIGIHGPGKVFVIIIVADE